MNADMPDMLSAEEREALLEKEDELAKVRAEEQRDFLDEQEKMRMARESSQRLVLEQEEQARRSELERQERMGQEVSQELVEDVRDVDTNVADMFSALAYGTDFMSEEDDAEVDADKPNKKRPK